MRKEPPIAEQLKSVVCYHIATGMAFRRRDFVDVEKLFADLEKILRGCDDVQHSDAISEYIRTQMVRDCVECTLFLAKRKSAGYWISLSVLCGLAAIGLVSISAWLRS